MEGERWLVCSYEDSIEGLLSALNCNNTNTHEAKSYKHGWNKFKTICTFRVGKNNSTNEANKSALFHD